jgi:membrane protein YqaA with SNARE-associated domain
LFVLAVIGFAPTIPDFLTVALLQKKLKFPYFVLAAIVGKTIQFLPFVFLGK